MASLASLGLVLCFQLPFHSNRNRNRNRNRSTTNCYHQCHSSSSLYLRSCTSSLFDSSSKSLPQHRQPPQLFSNKVMTRLKPKPRPLRIVAAQSEIVKVLQTAWKVGKDGVEAGTDLVPDSVPRPVARIAVTGVVGAIALFVLKSFLSTAFFVLGVMGLIYFVFIALNKDEGPRGGGGSGGSSDPNDSLEEARRIMEKYK